MKNVELSRELLKKHWRPIGVVLIILMAVAIYWVRGYLLAVKAEKAYHINADCQCVIDTVTTLRQQYPDSIAPYADQWTDVCQAFLSADAKRSSGDWQNAVKEFTKFLEMYGQSPIAQLARTSLKESLLNWAQEQHQAGQYETALKTYEMIPLENADIRTQIESERTQVCLEWAQKERRAGQYEVALKVYDMIKGDDETIKAQVARERTQVYLEWATDLKERGEVEQAEQVLANLWNLQKIDRQQAFTASLEWAQDHCQAGQYAAALRIYDLIKEDNETAKAKVARERTHVYLEWAVALKKRDETQQAEQVLLDLWRRSDIDRPLAFPVCLRWAQEYHQAEQYEAALKVYDVIKEYDEATKAQIESERMQVYLDWAAALKKRGDAQQAEQVLLDLWRRSDIDRPLVFSVCLRWAQEYHQAGQYEAALKVYDVIKEYDEATKVQIEGERMQVYLDWAAALKKRGDAQQSEQILVDLWNRYEIDLQQAIAVGLTEEELMKALSQSTGAYAQRLMNQALSTACNGQPSDSAALASSGTHRAMVLSTGVNIVFYKLKATTPGDFYYAICIKKHTNNLDTCTYTPFGGLGAAVGYIVPQQISWDVEIREVRTGKKIDAAEIRGSRPTCPSNASFTTQGETKYETGTEPSSSEALDWIGKILEKQEQIQVYLEQAQEQRQAGQYEAALKTYEMVPLENEEIKAQVAKERMQVYLEWAQEQRQAGQYEAALTIYDLIKGGDEDTKTLVARERTQVYLDWIAALKKNDETQQAEQVLADLWNLQEIDQQQAFTVSLEWAQERRQVGQYEAALKIYDLIKAKDEKTKAKVANVRTQGYLEWAADLKKTGEVEQAEQVLAKLWTLQEIDQQHALAVSLEWARAQRHTGQYEAAIKIYDLIKAKDEKTKAKVVSACTQAYLEWVTNLKKSGELHQAEQVLAELWNLQEIDRQQALEVGLTEDELMNALSRSTGAHAQQLMKQALSMACQGQPSDSAVLGVSGTRRAMMFGTRVNISLSDELKATMPGELYYAICLTRRTREGNSCQYLPFGVIIPQQIIWEVEIREVRTGKEIDTTELRGTMPTCPSSASFKMGEGAQHKIGTSPSSSEALDWIKKTLEKQEQIQEYLEQAHEQRQAGQYEAALKTYEMIPLENAEIRTQVESERIQVCLEWAHEQHQAGQYEATLAIYDRIKGEDKDTKALVASKRTQVYLEWATDLKERGETQQAEQVLADLWNLRDIDRQQVFVVSLEWAQECRQAGQHEAALRIYDLIKVDDETTKDQVASDRTQVYFEWIATLKQRGEVDQAEQVLEDLWNHREIDRQQTFAVSLKWAQERRQAGQYAMALRIYDLIKADDETTKEKVASDRMHVYFEWMAALKQRGEVGQAEQVLAELWNLQEIDQQQAIEFGLTEEELMNALSRSTGAYAQQLMKQAISKACKGQPSDSAVLGVSETRRAMTLGTGVNISLPDELKATTPGELYYAICLTRRIREGSRCQYIPFGVIVPQQIIWEVEIRDIRTGKKIDATEFRGSMPTCPSSASFKMGEGAQYKTGMNPSSSEALDWIKKTLEKQYLSPL